MPLPLLSTLPTRGAPGHRAVPDAVNGSTPLGLQ